MAQITLPVTEAERLTGAEYTPERVAELLRVVGCTGAVEEPVDGVFAVTPPSWRPDLTLAADLVEEVARLDGYDNIPVVCRPPPPVAGSRSPRRRVAFASAALADGGLVEVKSYPFVSDTRDRQGIPADDSRRQALRLRNPMADDTLWLRTSVLDTLLDVAGRNVPLERGRGHLRDREGRQAPRDGSADLPGAEHRPGDVVLAALMGISAQPWCCWRRSDRPAGRLRLVFCLRSAHSIGPTRRMTGYRPMVCVEVTRAWADTAASHKGAPDADSPPRIRLVLRPSTPDVSRACSCARVES